MNTIILIYTDMTLEEFKALPKNSEWDQKNITYVFLELYNAQPEFIALRTFVEEHAFGFGEKVFYPLHKMVIESLPNDIKFLEIGVFRGQTLALIKLLSKLCSKNIDVYGVTPLDSTDGHWESDYANDVKIIHDKFNLEHPTIIKGLSTDTDIIKEAKDMYDIVYVDGGHSYEVVKSDLSNYPQMIKHGGYLIIDDCANHISGCYWGEFWGIESVSKAVDEFLPPKTEHPNFEYIGNVIHNRIWKRLK